MNCKNKTANYCIIKKVILSFILFFSLGTILFWLPNLGTPIQMRDAWLNRLRTASTQNIELKNSIPDGYTEFGISNANLLESNLSFYKYTGRFHFLWLSLMDFASIISNENPEIWRLINIFIMSVLMSIFWLICIKLGFKTSLAYFLSIALILFPASFNNPWTFTITNEAPATILLLIAIYLIINKNNLKTNIIASILILLSCFFKESFAIFWVTIFWLYLWLEFKKENNFKLSILHSLKSMIPHILACLFYIFIIIVLKGQNNSSEVTYLNFSLAHSDGNLFLFIIYSFIGLFSIILPIQIVSWEMLKIYLPIFLFVFFPLILFIYEYRNNLKSLLSLMNRASNIIIIGLVISILMQMILLFAIYIPMMDYHVLPSNFFFALIIGFCVNNIYNDYTIPFVKKYYFIILTCFAIIFIYPYYYQFDRTLINLLILSFILILFILIYKYVKKDCIKSLLAIIFFILMFSLHKVDFYIIDESISMREEQKGLQQVIDNIIYTAPKNSIIKIKLEHPEMIESCFNIEANTLIKGRYDLRYYVDIKSSDTNSLRGKYIQKEATTFNKNKFLTSDKSDIKSIEIINYNYKEPEKHSIKEVFFNLFNDPFSLIQNRYLRNINKKLKYIF